MSALPRTVHATSFMGSGGDKHPQFSVVIPTCGRPERLAQCLERLAEGCQSGARLVHRHLWVSDDSQRGLGYEVIVSDDTPSPGVHGVIAERFPWVEVVEGPRHGPAANRNRGAREASGRWLVFLDDDVLPDGALLANYADALQNDGMAVAMEGCILPEEPPEGDGQDCPINMEGGCFWSANIAVCRKTFERLGGFDERFRIAAQEDTDLYWRLGREGTVVFAREAVVRHPVRRLGWGAVSIRDVIERKRAYALLIAKHRPPSGAGAIARETGRDLGLSLRLLLSALARGHVLSASRALMHSVFGPPVFAGFLLRRNKLLAMKEHLK